MMMETSQMTKRILDFQKDVFSQWYDVLTCMQEQATTSLQSVMDQSNWMPDEGRRMLQNWVDACQKGCDDYKELVEDSLSGLEKVLVIPSKKAAASNKAPVAKKAAKKRSPRKAKTTAAAKAETASTAEKSEDMVPPTTESPKAVVMEKESASVADMDETAK
jgi:hypothetical protein